MLRIPAVACVTVLSAAALMVTLTAAPGAGTAAEPRLDVHDDVVFGRGGELELKLDLARPAVAAKPTPAVLIFHGGGWVQGDKRQFRSLARFVAEEGYFAASVQYRLAIPGPRNPHPWPAQIEDAKCAVRWLRANCKRWNVDPERIAVMGFSAGAHLAMLLGTMDKADGLEGEGGHAGHSSKANAVVAFYGPTDMGIAAPENRLDIAKLSLEKKKGVLRGMALSQIFGRTFAADPTRASPLSYVDKGDAPTLLFQGTKDRLVQPYNTEMMVDALTKAGVPGRAVFMVGLGHGWRTDPHLSSNVRDTQRFLEEQFRPERVTSILSRINGR